MFRNTRYAHTARHATYTLLTECYDVSFTSFPAVPEENVATHQHGTMCIEGTMKETLLNGDHENYNMDYGYTLHMINDTNDEGITGMWLCARSMCSHSYYIHSLYW